MPGSEDSSCESYGQTLRSVRDGLDEARGPSWPADVPLPPRGLSKPRRSSPRLQGFDYTGPYAYSITINTAVGRPYFDEDRFVRFCIKALLEKAEINAIEVLAYCFMPNHVHLLALGLTESSQLEPFMKQFKQIAGFAYKQETGIPLWHRSYHDRVLRVEESLQSVSSYIWGNPVRAGLVENREDYPYSGPVERLLGEAGRLDEEATLGGQTLRSVRTDSARFQH